MKATYGPFRVEVNGSLRLQSSFRIGSPDQLTLATDMPVLRSDGDGMPYIPGSSLRGILRAHLAREHNLLGCNEEVLKSLFGDAGARREDDAETVRGRLRIFDSHPISPSIPPAITNLPGHPAHCDSPLMLPSSSPTTRRAGIPASGPPFQAADLSPSHSPLNPELPEPPLRSEIRDHVRISSETGTAEDRAKFDRESVTPAAQWSFPLRMIYEGDGEEDDELILLSEALRALEQKELTVGGNAGIGFGRLELTGPTVRAFSRRTASGLLAFLRSRYPVPGAVVEAASLVFAFPKPKAPIELNQPAPWNTLTFEIKLRCNGPLLIKAPKGIVKLEPDSTYLTKAGSNEPYVPGSSLRGVLRHRAHKICASQRLTSDLVSTLFGSAKGDGSGTRGLVKIEDGGVSPNEGVCSDHVAIDRITHAAAEKFDNRALDSPAVSFRIHAPFSESVEHRAAVALLLLLVRDLLAEPCAIAIGSQTSRGYGSIESAALQLVEGSFCLGLAGKAPKYGVEQRGARTSFTAKGESKVFDDLCALFDPAWQEICGRKTAP